MAGKRIKTGGRESGTPNKLTFHTRQLLLNALSNELEQLPDLLEKLKPYQRVDCIIKLCKYALPAMANISAANAESYSFDSPENIIEAIEFDHIKARKQREIEDFFL
jgi:hypothetical protein